MKKEPTVRTTVLLPESLYAKLKEIAEEERRSTHKQIIVALERFVAGRPAAPTTGAEQQQREA